MITVFAILLNTGKMTTVGTCFIIYVCQQERQLGCVTLYTNRNFHRYSHPICLLCSSLSLMSRHAERPQGSEVAGLKIRSFSATQPSFSGEFENCGGESEEQEKEDLHSRILGHLASSRIKAIID